MTESGWEKLPLELRRMVYKDLLHASNVRQYPDPQRLITQESLYLRLPENELIGPRDAYDCNIAWEVFDLMVSIAQRAHEAFGLGHFGRALAKYQDILRLFAVAFVSKSHGQSSWSAIDDSSHSILAMRSTAFVNQTICALQSRAWDFVAGNVFGSEEYPAVDQLTTSDKSVVHHCPAIALAAQQKDEQAWEHLEKAIMLNPMDNLVQEHLNVTQKRLNADTDDQIYSEELIRQFKPLAIIPQIILATSDNYIANERYLLQHFGYKRDLLHNIQDSSPVDMHKMADDLWHIELNRTRVKANGGKSKFWIDCPLFDNGSIFLGEMLIWEGNYGEEAFFVGC